MVEPADFVDGTSIRTRALAGTVVGAIVLEWFYGLFAWIESAGLWFRRFVTTPLETYTNVMVGILEIPGTAWPAAWGSAADFTAMFGAAGGGPLAYVLAIAIVVATLLVADWAIRRAGVI